MLKEDEDGWMLFLHNEFWQRKTFMFSKTWGISMKFSGKMWVVIILKVTKKQAFTLSLEDTYFEKPQGAWGGEQMDPSPPVVLGLRLVYSFSSTQQKLCYLETVCGKGMI